MRRADTAQIPARFLHKNFRHPSESTDLAGRELTDAEAEAIVDEFDAASNYVVTGADALAELRAAATARREAESRIEAAALQAHRNGASWGVIGAQLGMTRQGARQRFEPLTRD